MDDGRTIDRRQSAAPFPNAGGEPVAPFTPAKRLDNVTSVVDPEVRKARADRFKRIERADWERLLPKLTVIARKKLGRAATLEDAEDLAQEAIAQCVAQLERWDPETTTLVQHIGWILNEKARNRRRNSSVRKERPAPDEDAAADSSRAPADARYSEETYVMRDFVRRATSLLEVRLAGDELGLAVLFCFMDGMETPLEQAARLDCPLHRITAARRRLERHAEKVFAELEGE